MKTNEIKKALQERGDRSAWDKGVTAYALELVEQYEDTHGEEMTEKGKDLEAVLLNGASDWSAYSWGGCALIYNGDIAERLCTPSELKKTRDGERRPNSHEEWLDTQARALHQAYRRINGAVRYSA